MPVSCSVCIHKKRDAIERDMLAGVTFRNMAKRYDLNQTALFRHKTDHLPPALIEAKQAAEVVRADSLLDQLAGLAGEAREIKAKAIVAGDLRAALVGVRELVRIVELLAKLRGELDERAQVNVLVAAPEWVAMRARLLRALEPYPDARAAVLAALEAGDAG